MPTAAEFDRYARQTVLPQVGRAGQRRLLAAKVLVVGAGGLGCPVLQYLAGAGVGRLVVVDPDTVSEHNLHRQTFYTAADVGRAKCDAMAERLTALNPDCEIEPVRVALGPRNARGWVADADLVLDCADSVAVSYILSDTCLTADTPLISASALGLSGYVGGFCAGAPSLRAVFPALPNTLANCNEAGVLGPVVGLLGCAQAQMALAVLLDLPDSPLGRLWQFDANGFRASSMQFGGAPEPVPDAIFPFIDAADVVPGDRVFELRDTAESASPAHPDAIRVDEQGVSELAFESTDARTVFCCHAGVRAWRAASQLHASRGGDFALIAATTLTPNENTTQ
ncbi:MAG: HesA/MoeB/ThiF family protein [Pseudomonadota bacterium]